LTSTGVCKPIFLQRGRGLHVRIRGSTQKKKSPNWPEKKMGLEGETQKDLGAVIGKGRENMQHSGRKNVLTGVLERE